jgi:hypothetical protein
MMTRPSRAAQVNSRGVGRFRHPDFEGRHGVEPRDAAHRRAQYVVVEVLVD